MLRAQSFAVSAEYRWEREALIGAHRVRWKSSADSVEPVIPRERAFAGAAAKQSRLEPFPTFLIIDPGCRESLNNLQIFRYRKRSEKAANAEVRGQPESKR